MNGCTVVLEMVVDSDFDQVAPAGLDPRAGILAIEDLAKWIIDTVAVDGLISDIEVILVSVRKVQVKGDERGVPLL